MIYIITRTCLDLCNFYGPSVRISARYKTPNPLCSTFSSSPLYLLAFSLFLLPKNITPETRSFTHHFTRLADLPEASKSNSNHWLRANLDLFPISLFLPRSLHSISLITPAATPRYSFIIFSSALLAISSLVSADFFARSVQNVLPSSLVLADINL